MLPIDIKVLCVVLRTCITNTVVHVLQQTECTQLCGGTVETQWSSSTLYVEPGDDLSTAVALQYGPRLNVQCLSCGDRALTTAVITVSGPLLLSRILDGELPNLRTVTANPITLPAHSKRGQFHLRAVVDYGVDGVLTTLVSM